MGLGNIKPIAFLQGKVGQLVKGKVKDAIVNSKIDPSTLGGGSFSTSAAARRKRLLSLQRGFLSTIRGGPTSSDNTNLLTSSLTGKDNLGQ